MRPADLTVMGAGIFGLSAAVAAGLRGARVRVIDPGGVGAGASGGVVGALAPFPPGPPDPLRDFQLAALGMAEGFWAEAQRLTGQDPGFARIGRLQPLPDAAAVARAEARIPDAAARWPEGTVWEVVPAGGGWAPVAASGRMIRDTFAARLHPARALACLAAAVEALGGEVVEDGVAEGPVIWATGAAGLDDLSAVSGQVAGGGVKGQAAVLRFEAGGRPQDSGPGLHIVPHDDGTVAVGSTSEKTWDDPAATDARLDDVIARARAVLPALAEAPVIRRWAGLRPRAATGRPMLGPHPFRQNAWIVNGGFKIGFALAPLAGEWLAEMILEGASAIPEEFLPEASLAE